MVAIIPLIQIRAKVSFYYQLNKNLGKPGSEQSVERISFQRRCSFAVITSMKIALILVENPQNKLFYKDQTVKWRLGQGSVLSIFSFNEQPVVRES